MPRQHLIISKNKTIHLNIYKNVPIMKILIFCLVVINAETLTFIDVDKKIAKVSKNCQTHLMDIKKSLMKSAKELENGSIQIRKLNLILESKREYKEVIAVIWEHEHCEEFEEGRISYLLERRHKELEKIDETFKHIIGFKEFLQCFEGITDTI